MLQVLSYEPYGRHVPKLWGYETIFVNGELYCGKILTVLPNGNACSIHYHKLKTETFHVLRGELILEFYAKSSEPTLDNLGAASRMVLVPGNSITLLPFTPHRFWTCGALAEFIEVSTTDCSDDSYRLAQAGPYPKGDSR